MILSRLSAKWQTTVPRSVREALGVGPGDSLSYRIEGDQVFVSKAENDDEEDEIDLQHEADIRAAIDEILNDPHPRPTVSADEAFANVRRRLEDQWAADDA